MKQAANRLSLKSRLGFNFYDIFVYIFTGLFGIVCFYPLWFVICGSVNPTATSATGGLVLWPEHGISFNCYAIILSSKVFQRSILISVSKTVIASLGSLMITAMIAYGVSKINIKGMKALNFLTVFTMYFGGGLIPFYLLMLQLRMADTFWVYILPSLMNAYWFIILRNYFQTSVEQSLEESAMIDGGTELTVFFRIVLPLSSPILSAILLFLAVGQWNDYATYLFYCPTNVRLEPYVMVLRDILVDPTVFTLQGDVSPGLMAGSVVATNMKMATIVVAMLPIMILYPFLQKNFTAGIMVGAVKE